jgi:hypothetical protein
MCDTRKRQRLASVNWKSGQTQARALVNTTLYVRAAVLGYITASLYKERKNNSDERIYN